VGRALVSFDIALPLPPDLEATLPKEIEKRWGRAPKRLVPAPLQAGTVTLTVARPGAADGDKQFFVYSGHSPALTGDNRAALAIAAEGDEAQALVAAMSVGHLAGVVTYELEMPGLAPSFHAHMTVHWNKIYERFRQHDTTNFVIAAEEIDRTIEHLEDKKDIDVRVENLDPEESKSATRALFDELKSQVIKNLFESPAPTGDTPIEERIGRGVREVLTSLMPGVSHTLRSLDQSTLQDTTIDLSEQKVNTYKLYPQSTLAGMLERGGHAASRLNFVRVEDLPNRVEQVTVEIAGGAARLGVRGVEVRVQVLTPGRPESLADESVHLAAASSERKTVNYRRLGVEDPAVRCRVEMLMDPAVAPGGQERWSFDWRPVEGNRIWFDPEEWLDVAEVRVEIDDPAIFETARVSMDIEAGLVGSAAPPLRKANLQFSKEALSQSFPVVIPDGAKAAFKGKETFRRTGEPDFIRDVPSISASVHRVMNPFGQSWRMDVRAVSSWTDTVSLFAEFRVWDVLRKTWLLAEQQFDKSAASFPLKFSTCLETPRKAEVRVTRVTTDGGVIRGPWQDLAGAVVAITDDVIAERRIRATLAVPAFQALNVQKVFVDVEYHNGDINVSQTLELTHDGAIADCIHAFPEPTHPFFKYRIRARSTEGGRYVGPWAESGADDLTITLPDNPWTE